MALTSQHVKTGLFLISLCIHPCILAKQPDLKAKSNAWDQKQQKAILKNHTWIDVDASIPDDPEMKAFLQPYTEELKKSHGQELAHAPKGLNRGGVEQHNEVGFWVADVMRATAKAITGKPVHFALINTGGIRANIPPGPVTYGKLLEVMPFDNELVVAEYSGEQVIKFITQAVRKRGAEPCSGLHIQLNGPLNKPELLIRWEDGSPIDPKACVWVAITDYLLANGDKSPGIRGARRVIPTGKKLRDVLKDAAIKLGQDGQPLQADVKKRVNIDPIFYDRLRNYQALF